MVYHWLVQNLFYVNLFYEIVVLIFGDSLRSAWQAYSTFVAKRISPSRLSNLAGSKKNIIAVIEKQPIKFWPAQASSVRPKYSRSLTE